MTSEKFEYFIERTERDLDEIKLKLDQLWSFRTLLLGASAAISAIFSIVVTFIMIKFGS